MERLIRICLTWILVCLVSVAGTLWVYGETTDAEEREDLNLHARAAVLMDGENGRLLYGENEDTPMAMASTTKIMTCLIALENSKMDDVVVISEYAASMPDVQLDAVAGDSFYMKDLLYSLMLESHNDVAVAVAEHVGGSEEGFAAMMNQRAKELGCEQTNFVTANGLDAEAHYTTAAELAKITVEAIKNEKLIDIINTPFYSFTNVEGTRQYQVNNKDTFLQLMDGAFGVKTGFTNDAGYCFVGALERDEKTLISVVLGSGWPPNKNYKWQDTSMLMNYGLEKYEKKDIGKENIDVGLLEIQDGIKEYVLLKTDCQVSSVLLSDEDQVSIQIVKDIDCRAPVEENEVVGWVYYRINDMIVEKFPIYTTEDVLRKTFGYCLKKLAFDWIAL